MRVMKSKPYSGLLLKLVDNLNDEISYIVLTKGFLNPNQICIVPFGTLFLELFLNTDALSKKKMEIICYG